MCVKTSLICRTKWFCNKEFLSWLSAGLFSWSHDKSRISLGTVSSTHLLGMSQTEPLYFSLCPGVCHIYIYWPCCYLMPSVSDWKRCLYFLILLLCIPKSFSPLLEKQDLVIFADLKVLGNWTESRLFVLESAEAPGGYRHIQILSGTCNKTKQDLGLCHDLQMSSRASIIFDRPDKFGFVYDGYAPEMGDK